MRQRLIISVSSEGFPSAEVPFACMWDLVEYLSYQRVATSYQYHASHFTVTFPRLDEESAQRILDEWVHAGAAELTPA